MADSEGAKGTRRKERRQERSQMSAATDSIHSTKWLRATCT